ncbi:hypothetical protein LOK49_LG03G00135 [Camellia lanceoleosa]|uniref:Uncharacterized protein n=1 Tax=Camellia lanceoleosa TaxID=1840588 RepID=A0ACC0IAM8_9ERIC|nr:hypothetical protein LOK49_LG03G00135 [Camellia lanceoleosa]
MPASPAMRCSPGREIRGDNHRRGRSLEGGILLREKDDDLALFNEMETRERDSFLLQSNDDFEDTFSTKLRYLSDYKLEISIPARGESSDLLNADGEKNDYDWLLTPPDTPLFRSLDDETPPVTLPQRGRARSQPITISRSSTMEKSHRSSRGSASPNRLSPSPRSGNSTFQTRGRPSSAPHYSQTPSIRHATPVRRPSPPPSKPSSPAPRSSTPTHWKMSPGSSGTVSSYGVRGTSPLKTSRGNSASPKIRAWQTNIPGFSLDAPPNLRTSLADRPASYVRGSSPASRNGRDSSSRSGRQSMSPTASRSISSSHSHDRDRFSSHSKASVASSGDDDVDSPQSVPMSSSDRSASRRVGAFPSNKAPAFSKKPTKTMLSSSAPKRSFDSALRQMDHRKRPQDMFRPLLSSVPSSTFYVGKASAAHRAMISRNSSVTTSSNASSDQGTSGAHDTEESDHNQDDMASECGKSPYPDVQDDVFGFEKAGAVTEDVSHVFHDGSRDVQRNDFSGDAKNDSLLGDSRNFDYHSTAVAITEASEGLEVKGNFSEGDSVEDMTLCSRCCRGYHAIELTGGDLKLCPDCRSSDEPLTVTTPAPTIIVSENFPSPPPEISVERKSFDAMDPVTAVSESSEVNNAAETRAAQHEEHVQESQTSFAEPSLNLLSENSLTQTLSEEDMRRLENQQVMDQPTVGYNPSDGDNGARKMQHLSDSPNLKLHVSEGTGISILLKRSSSSKGPVVQGRTFTATSIPYDDLSYVRDSATSMRSSFGLGSVSASSSVDLGSARQTETRVRRQLSSKKSDIETYRYDINTKHQRTGSSLSGTPSHAFQGLGLATSMNEENMEVAVARVENEAVGVTNGTTQEQLLVSESAGVDDTCTEVECSNHRGTMIASTSELSTHTLNNHLGDSSVASFSSVEDSISYGNGEGFQNGVRSISDREALAATPEPSTVEDDTMPNSIVDRVDVADGPTQSSLDTISEIEIENDELGSPGSQSDVISTNSKSTMDELLEPFVATTSDKDITTSVAELDTLDHPHGILDESTVTAKGHGGTNTRNLTLEEPSDTILICSSIIHDLANKAATIAMEKENSLPLEGSRPMVTILGNSNSDIKAPRGRTAGKRTSKSRKAKQRRVETDTKAAPFVDNDEKVDVSTMCIVGAPNKSDSMNPQKLESKCNCTVM